MNKSLIALSFAALILSVSPIAAKKPAKPKKPIAPVALPYKNHPLIGSYMLKNGEKWDGSAKFVLDPTGQFRFAGTNWMSKGTFTISNDQLRLQWTEVDGTKQKPGAMIKVLTVGAGKIFVIDQYKYFKRS